MREWRRKIKKTSKWPFHRSFIEFRQTAIFSFLRAMQRAVMVPPHISRVVVLILSSGYDLCIVEHVFFSSGFPPSSSVLSPKHMLLDGLNECELGIHPGRDFSEQCS